MIVNVLTFSVKLVDVCHLIHLFFKYTICPFAPVLHEIMAFDRHLLSVE